VVGKKQSNVTHGYFLSMLQEKNKIRLWLGSLPNLGVSHLNDKKHPCKCSYFSNSKAWMNTNIMTEILLKLNRRLSQRNRHIFVHG
jgi:hypothetical protein